MPLTQLTPQQIAQGLATAYNANAAIPANLGTGSSLSAIFNAIEALSIGLQQQISYDATISRLQTVVAQNPSGQASADAASFVFPFGYTPIAPVSATGTVTFGTPSPAGSQINIAPGTLVQTSGGIQFQVIADTNQSGWNAGQNAYIIGVGQSSVNATVQAMVSGITGNVAPNTITVLISTPSQPAPPGVNTVNNAAAFTNGAAGETNQALYTRFQAGMASRWATAPAMRAMLPTASSGLTFTVGDQIDQNGNAAPNFFSIIVNTIGQSTGPSQAVLNAVTTVVNNNRPVGMPFTITGPTLLTVAVNATLTLQGGAVASSVIAAAQTAMQTYLNNLGLDPFGNSTTAQAAEITVLLKAVSGVSNVTGLTLNGSTSDITAGYGTQIVSGNITFTTQ